MIQVDGLADRGDLGDVTDKHIDYKEKIFSLVLRARRATTQQTGSISIPLPLAPEAGLDFMDDGRKHQHAMSIEGGSDQGSNKDRRLATSQAVGAGSGRSTFEATAGLRVKMQLPPG